VELPLASEILVRFSEDQEVRQPAPHGNPATLAEERARVDEDNLVWLRVVLRGGRWPWIHGKLLGEHPYQDRVGLVHDEAVDVG
jgi:hypothetical protein